MAALVVFVFVLALGAKLSMYDPPHPGAINPVSASKLWVSGEKLETMPPGLLPVLWLTTLLFFLPRVPRILRSEPCRTHAPRRSDLRELYRFFRPPPPAF